MARETTERLVGVVPVNSWSDAAEADMHMGKAGEFTMKAYGKPTTATTVMDRTRFTLTAGGKVTGQGAAAIQDAGTARARG